MRQRRQGQQQSNHFWGESRDKKHFAAGRSFRRAYACNTRFRTDDRDRLNDFGNRRQFGRPRQRAAGPDRQFHRRFVRSADGEGPFEFQDSSAGRLVRSRFGRGSRPQRQHPVRLGFEPRTDLYAASHVERVQRRAEHADLQRANGHAAAVGDQHTESSFAAEPGVRSANAAGLWLELWEQHKHCGVPADEHQNGNWNGSDRNRNQHGDNRCNERRRVRDDWDDWDDRRRDGGNDWGKHDRESKHERGDARPRWRE